MSEDVTEDIAEDDERGIPEGQPQTVPMKTVTAEYDEEEGRPTDYYEDVNELLADMHAATEDDSERDGLFSWKGETHAFAIGFGAGFALATRGDTQLAAAVLTAVLGGNRVGKRKRREGGLSRSLAKQVFAEATYAVAGLVLGMLAGAQVAGTDLPVGELGRLLQGVIGL